MHEKEKVEAKEAEERAKLIELGIIQEEDDSKKKKKKSSRKAKQVISEGEEEPTEEQSGVEEGEVKRKSTKKEAKALNANDSKIKAKRAKAVQEIAFDPESFNPFDSKSSKIEQDIKPLQPRKTLTVKAKQ